MVFATYSGKPQKVGNIHQWWGSPHDWRQWILPRQSGKSLIASASLRVRHRLQPRHGRMTADWKFR